MHPVIAELDATEFEFTGQETHVDAAVASTATEYEPTPQTVHTALPLFVLYLPATHDVHAPSGPVFPAVHINVQLAKAVLASGVV